TNIAGTQVQIVYDNPAKQILKVMGASGTFKLSFQGAQTPALAYNATAAAIEAALNQLTTIYGTGSTAESSVTVTKAATGNNFTVVFSGLLASQDVPLLTATSDRLFMTVEGFDGSKTSGSDNPAKQIVKVVGASGNFKLGFKGAQTEALPYNATA